VQRHPLQRRQRDLGQDISASTSVPASSWQTAGSAALSLAAPTTLDKLQAGEVYRVNLLWTASTGP
jgi:hypothetical protein